jgi:hypothetical protein
MSKMPKVIAAAILTGVLELAREASAEPSPADVLLARQLGTDGIELAQRGDCAGALTKLERAESLHHAPTLLLRIGECQIHLGRFIAALSSLDRVAREKLEATSPKAFVIAQQRAATLMEEIRPKLATLQIEASGPRTGATFRLDDDELKEAALGLDRPVNPGAHVIEVTIADGRRVRRELQIAAGATERVTLELPVPATTPSDIAHATASTRSSSESGTMRTLGWGLAGGGAAAVAVGAIFAGLTLSTKSDLDSVCSAGKVCPSSSKSDYDSAKTTATISGIALGVGVIAAAAGVYLLVTRKGDGGGRAAWLDVAQPGGARF